jgi:hypothetical protein
VGFPVTSDVGDGRTWETGAVLLSVGGGTSTASLRRSDVCAVTPVWRCAAVRDEADRRRRVGAGVRGRESGAGGRRPGAGWLSPVQGTGSPKRAARKARRCHRGFDQDRRRLTGSESQGVPSSAVIQGRPEPCGQPSFQEPRGGSRRPAAPALCVEGGIMQGPEPRSGSRACCGRLRAAPCQRHFRLPWIVPRIHGSRSRRYRPAIHWLRE